MFFGLKMKFYDKMFQVKDKDIKVFNGLAVQLFPNCVSISWNKMIFQTIPDFKEFPLGAAICGEDFFNFKIRG